jgi:uncharacterized protein (TIGR02466 family)
MKDTIHSLFPVPIYQTSLDRNFSTKENLFFNKQKNKTRKIEGNSVSLNTYILEDPCLKQLKKELLNAVDKYYINIIDAKDKINPYITQSWLNYSNKGDYHHSHEHPNSLVSGVFYIKADEQKDKITFHKNFYSTIKLRPKNYNLWNSLSWWIPVKSGDILLFPSYLNHSVETKEDNDIRISLAFNTFLKGSLGNNRDLSELNL